MTKNLLLENRQLWIALIGSIVPLGGYVLNKYAPWSSETVKGIVQVVLAAVAGALYIALDNGTLGFNGHTVELVVTGVVSALFAHNFLYKPAKVNEKLGAVERAPVRE